MELLNTDISIYLSNASLKLRLHLDTNSVFYFLKNLYKNVKSFTKILSFFFFSFKGYKNIYRKPQISNQFSKHYCIFKFQVILVYYVYI